MSGMGQIPARQKASTAFSSAGRSERLKIDAFTLRPERWMSGSGVGICAQFALALADDMSTPKAFSERGDLPAEAESRGGDKPPIAVHAWLKEL